MSDESWTNPTGYDSHSTASSTQRQRPDLRWGRLTLAHFGDEEFLAKELRRIELTQGARRVSRPLVNGDPLNYVDSTPQKSIRQRLEAAQSRALRTSEDEDGEVKQDAEVSTKQTMNNEDKELVNSLCVLGNLQQPELAAVLMDSLKDKLRRLCTFPNPIYQLIALRRHLIKSMHEAVAAQHRQHKAAIQANLSIIEGCSSGVSASGPESTLLTIKPKEKVSREAALGIQVLVSLLTDLHDSATSSLAQRREFLGEILPILQVVGFMTLSTTSSSRGSTEIAEFVDKTQKFLLSMCPRPLSRGISSASPKLQAIVSAGDLDVQDRTNAVNGLIHLAAATSSVKDFLVVVKVLLGASDSETNGKELRSASSRSLPLAASVPSISTVISEESLSSPVHSARDDDSLVSLKIKGFLKSPRDGREDENLGDNTVQEILKRKALKGGRAISSNANATTVNLAMTHHRLYNSPGNNLVGTFKKDDLQDANASLSLDISKMKESLSRENLLQTNRGDTPIVTARCPKFKALEAQSVLYELNRAKPSVRVKSRRKTNEMSATDDEAEDREVWSCGQNSYGELGHGDTTSRKSFERIESLQHKEIIQIGAGNEHTIALTSDGRVLTCGYNDNGQCGQGGTARVSHLSEVSNIESGIAQVHAYNGCEHTILVTTEGRAATCGYNYRGQLGHGNTASENAPKLIRSLDNKVVRLVSCSYYHTVMACEEDGSGRHFLYTFGRNDYGQLGHNDSIDRKVPQTVDALSDQHVVSVACGQYHTMVVTASGKAFAFGKNDYGQLGVESMENQLVPIQVRGGLEKQECLEIRCGYYHTIVLCSGAHLFGFGRNDYGQLGLSKPSASSTTNLQLQQQRFSSPKLIEELEGKDIIRIACGCYHTIAVSENGVLYVFGRNNHGQLGTGDTNERVYPFPIDDFVDKRIALVAAGFYHTVVLTGGKDDDKCDQELNDKAESLNVASGVSYSLILAAPAVQELLDNSVQRSTIETPAIDDFQDEDSLLKESRPKHAADPLLLVIIIMAQLDRLCQPFIPKQGSFPTLQHPPVNVTESLQKKADVCGVFEGSFESFGIHSCSSTFDTLAVLLRYLSTKKMDVTAHVAACFQSLPQDSMPRRLSSSSSVQMYLLLACIRILQANLSQLLRSGMAKTVILLAESWGKELDQMRVAILQVREVLMSLVDIKNRRQICSVFDTGGEVDTTTRIADEATTTLMQGFELFFPCQCLRRQFCLHVLHDRPSDQPASLWCGILCRRELWSIESYPKSKATLLGPLLRRMADDSLIIRLLPLQPIGAVNSTLPVMEMYRVLLDRMATDFTRSLGKVVDVRPLSSIRRETTTNVVFEAFAGLQKHLSSWASTVDEWSVKYDDKGLDIDIVKRVSNIIERTFRVDEQDLNQVPTAWRCFIEFVLGVVAQSCDVLAQVTTKEPYPSPTHGYSNNEHLDDPLHSKMLQTVENSIVGQVLPSLIVSLFEFSNNSLFACSLLPSVKKLLRLVDGLNQRDNSAEAAERNFVEAAATSISSKAAQKPSNGSFRRKSEGNLLSARSEDERNNTKRSLTTADAMALPWYYRLEKELAILATEMAMTLVIGDPSCTIDFGQSPTEKGIGKMPERWALSPLFRGGLDLKLFGKCSKPNTRVVVHTPFTTDESRPFTLVLPPQPGCQELHPLKELPTHSNYRHVVSLESIQEFLQNGNNVEFMNKLCDWVRDVYARRDPSYRMLMRQAQLAMNLKASTNSTERQIHLNDIKIECAFFAALLHHQLLGIQAYHFALGLSISPPEQRKSLPQAFQKLWQRVAQLRRWIATQKTEIKNAPLDDSMGSPLDRILCLQQTILDHCKLLLVVTIHEEKEHLNLQLDGGYIPPYHPAYLVSSSSSFKRSSHSVKRHLQASYTEEKLPFLVAFPESKWRVIRVLFHTIIRWKALIKFTLETSGNIAQEAFDFVTSEEPVSSSNSIKDLLVDPCRRVSCSIRGLESVYELLTMVGFDSIQADIVSQFAQVFAFHKPDNITFRASQNAGYFYCSLHHEAFYELVGYLTETMTSKAAMMEGENPTTFWIVIQLLSVWGVHFNHHQFEFVSDIGILNVIQEMIESISRNSSRLRDILWVLFRYICVQFAVQNEQETYVPTFPVLAGVFELLFEEAIAISSGSFPLIEKEVKQVETPASAAVRRSFEIIILPRRFSAQSRGVSFIYNEMIAPSGSEVTSMSPLLKPNEFSVTTWLFINTLPPGNKDVLPSIPDRQLVFLRGAGHEISLYLLLIPESVDNYQLEVGILMDLSGESTKNRVWERMLSKQIVTGGKWIHVAVVMEASKLRLYLNGVLDSQRSLAVQSIPIWGSGSIDLPFQFGRISSDSAPISTAVSFLSGTFGMSKPTDWEPSNNAASFPDKPSRKSTAFKCFEGWLGHFRFHNRSLSPIHVRIVFDEKKTPSLSLEFDPSKVMELHALLILLSSSAEGLVHFTAQFSKWMMVLWKTFLGSNSAVMQLSAIRVLRAFLPYQNPLEVSNVLLQNDTHLELLGFNSVEDVFVQQVCRLIGFCISSCSSSEITKDSNGNINIPWTLMLAQGIHANYFSVESRGDINPQTDLPEDIETQYQSSKRQCLTLANELVGLLHHLFRCSNESWRESVVRIMTKTSVNYSTSYEDDANVVQFGRYSLRLATIKRVETVGALFTFSGATDFLRPGVVVELRGSRECAQILSLENQVSALPTPNVADITPEPVKTFSSRAHVHLINRSTSPAGDWYSKVFDWIARHKSKQTAYSVVNVEELAPAAANNPNQTLHPGIIYSMASGDLKSLIDSAEDALPALIPGDSDGVARSAGDRLLSMQNGCMLLKILVQIAGCGGGDELLARPSLIDVVIQLAVREDSNPKHETLDQAERKVSALRREVYSALMELGEEGEGELACYYSGGESYNNSLPSPGPEGEDDLDCNDIANIGYQTQRIEADNEVNNSDEVRPDSASWKEVERPVNMEAEDEDEDDGEDDDDDSLEDGEDEDEDEDGDAEESRAEFVEELMLMGFPEDWCVLALKQTENDIVSASAWIVDNLEYLSKLQSSLDKERDKNRDSPRFDEEDDDINENTPTSPLLVSNSWIQPTTDEIISSGGDTNNTETCDKETNGIPPLSDKEMGRKLFGEMYFPFEDGGYLSNTKSRFLKTWRTDAMEMKAKGSTSTAEPIGEDDKATSPFDEAFDKEISLLGLRSLLKLLKMFENTLAILYARQCLVTLIQQLRSTSTILYDQLFKLMKLTLLRGDQFTVFQVRRSGDQQLEEKSIDQVFTLACKYFTSHDSIGFTTTAFDFCLDQLEIGASDKLYEAVLWTQRELQRCDNTVNEEPAVELAVWILDALLTSPITFPPEYVANVIHRLRCCLGTANLPLKFIALRTISRLLSAVEKGIVRLDVDDFITAARLRHHREVAQDRLLFSQYLQGYVELIYVLQRHQQTGALSSTLSTAPKTKAGNFSLTFDRKRSRSSLLSFAEDGLSVSYSGNEVWKAACAVVGFSTGIHSWVVRIEKSSSPYLFVGVATRQANLDSFLGADDQSWGFIGDKALYYQRNRVRAYGETFTEGDCIGLRLDCEKGELSFSKNGVDLGVAFDNIVGEVCPAIAFYSRHQKLSFEQDSGVSSNGTDNDEISSTGEGGGGSIEDCLIACEVLDNWVSNKPMRTELLSAALKMTTAWLTGATKYVTTRSGKSLWVDVTKESCNELGFPPEDRVRTPRGDGVVVGVATGRVWVEVDGEAGAWHFHPSKLRAVNPIPITQESTASTISFSLSEQQFTEYGEHKLWCLAVDRELLTIVNDFCEVSRVNPWNLTPIQLLNLINEKTSTLEQTSVANILSLPQEQRELMIVARFAILRFGNIYVSRATPFFDLTWHYFLPETSSLPCRLIAHCRGSLFVCVKNSLFTALMEKTANSPKKADDEYDYPEDLPQLQVNRLKAAAAKCHQDTIDSLFLSLFGQSFEELHFLPLKTLRMVYSHPMDDGQLRSFKVKFEGEGVDDYGGPYREFFSQFFAELQMLHEAEGKESDVSVSCCMLPFFLPSPNWRNGVGANREKFVINGALICTQSKRTDHNDRESAEEKRQLYCEMFFFLGQMFGICLRTRVCIRLDLAMSVWKQLVGEDDSNPENALETLKEVDFVVYSLYKTLKGIAEASVGENARHNELEEQLEAMDLNFTTVLSDGRTVELCADGNNTVVTLSNLDTYLELMLKTRTQETAEVMNIMKQGLHSIMPASALALLTWSELEKRMCGVAEVDVKLLQANTEYDEELSPTDEFIQRFWRVLESLESEDKRAFLRFVWARSRLPQSSAQFTQKFKIQALASSGTDNNSTGSTAATGGWMDSQMPKSHTCFFALQLPRYSNDDICRDRLLYAVRNCIEMDGDFRLADTEMTGWTGISPTDQLRI